MYIYIYEYILRISNVEIRYNYHCQGHVRLYILYLESQHIESICVCLQCTLLQSHFLFKRNMFQKMFAFLYCDVCNPPSLFLFFLCLSSKRCKKKKRQTRCHARRGPYVNQERELRERERESTLTIEKKEKYST